MRVCTSPIKTQVHNISLAQQHLNSTSFFSYLLVFYFYMEKGMYKPILNLHLHNYVFNLISFAYWLLCILNRHMSNFNYILYLFKSSGAPKNLIHAAVHFPISWIQNFYIQLLKIKVHATIPPQLQTLYTSINIYMVLQLVTRSMIRSWFFFSHLYFFSYTNQDQSILHHFLT